MKQARLVWTALAVLMAGSVSLAVACDDARHTRASSASVTADASKAVFASTAACCKTGKGVSATAASTAGMCSASKSASAVSASASGMCSHGAQGVKSASARSACADKASAASAGTCSGHGMTTTAARSSHGECDACQDMAGCEQEIEAAGASTQIVPLKNGVMFVYTADSPASVHTVQAAMARRYDRMLQFASTGDKARLCASCKEMRGAAASGKLSREVVNIEGGCLTLVTSNDPSIVAKIHTMAGVTTASRVKS